MINLDQAKALLAELESDPGRIELYRTELESLIADCVDEIHRLAQSDEDKGRKMQIVGLEYRARLVPERCKAANRN